MAFDLPLVETPSQKLPFLLCLTLNRLELRDQHTPIKPIYIDFFNEALNYRCRHGGGRQQALAKAVGLKRGATPSVLDATAGLGREAFILASLGCSVQMIERSPVIAALLEDGLRRANQAQVEVVKRLQLIHDDSQYWLSHSNPQPDVIYLDPMYPHRTKSALVKKEMRIFRAIVGDDLDASNLLTVALKYACHRVVVKRPKFALPLNEIKPTFCIRSEKTRFDVYQTDLCL